jgi:hypothetical protein
MATVLRKWVNYLSHQLIWLLHHHHTMSGIDYDTHDDNQSNG